jgi:hypothetical protein
LVSSKFRRIAEAATPVTAQAQELLAQANLESAVYTATEGAHGFIRNLSGKEDRWGEADMFCLAFFIFLKD